MPLTDKGNTILAAMKKQFNGDSKGERVFYASINKGTVKGAEETKPKSYAARMASYGKRG